MPAPKGTQVSEAVIKPDQAAHLKHLGDSNVAPRGLSMGTGDHGTPVGRMDATYAKYTLKSTDTAGVQIIVPHTLGRVPAFANLVAQEIPAGAAATSHVVVTLGDRKSWTVNTFRANVASATTATGIVLTFMVG